MDFRVVIAAASLKQDVREASICILVWHFRERYCRGLIEVETRTPESGRSSGSSAASLPRCLIEVGRPANAPLQPQRLAAAVAVTAPELVPQTVRKMRLIISPAPRRLSVDQTNVLLTGKGRREPCCPRQKFYGRWARWHC